MMIPAALLPVVVLLPLAVGAALALDRHGRAPVQRWAVRAAAATSVIAIALAAQVIAGGSSLATEVSLGDRVTVGIVADRLNVVLLVLAALLGWVVQAFAARAMVDHPQRNRFLALASLLTAASALVALGASLVVVAAGWLATSAIVAALVGLDRDRPAARRAGVLTRRALAVGDLALVGAVAVVALAIGDLALPIDADRVASLASARLPWGIDAAPLTVAAVLLVVAGIARSALVPLHRWLPATLAAPTPVSALLHAGVINGAGVLLVRHVALVGASRVAMVLAFAVAVLTAVLATSVMALRPDTKGTLAWSTAGQMGFMVGQIAVGAVGAAVFHLVGHALYKAAAFLGAGGAIDAARRARHLPRREVALGRGAQLVASMLLPALSLVVALSIVQPDLDGAKLLLVVVFAGAAGARIASGWLRTAPLPTPLSVGLLAVALPAAATAYVAAIAGTERYLADAVAVAIPGRVEVTTLAVVLVLLTLCAAVVRHAPGARAERLRLNLYAWLVSTGAPRVDRGAHLGAPSATTSVDLLDTRPPHRPGRLATEART